MSDEHDHDPEQVAFYVYGVDANDIDHAWEVGGGEADTSFDHEAHQAATAAMDAVKDLPFDWTDDIDGVAMGVREENE